MDSARALLLAGRFFEGQEANELWTAGRQILLDEIENHFVADASRAVSRPASLVNLAQAVMEYLVFTPKYDGEDDDERRFFKEKFRDILNSIESILLPDRSLPLFGPAPESPVDDVAALFAIAAVLLNEPLWKNLAGKFGVLPYMLLGESGKTAFDNLPEAQWSAGTVLNTQCEICRLSSSVGSAMVVNGRLPRSRQDHQDGLTYELAIRGQRVVVDSGAYAAGDDAREKYFSSPRAHNVLLVDGKGPRPKGSLPSRPSAKLSEHPDISMGLRLVHQGLPFPGVTHRRAWWHLDEETWVILDRLVGKGSHSATSLIHFYPTFEIEVRDNVSVVRSHSLTLSVIPLITPGQTPPIMVATRGDHPDFQSWYAPESGMKFASSVLRLEWREFSPPFVGGYLIIPGTEVSFEPGEMDARAGSISFRLGGKLHELSLG